MLLRWLSLAVFPFLSMLCPVLVQFLGSERIIRYTRSLQIRSDTDHDTQPQVHHPPCSVATLAHVHSSQRSSDAVAMRFGELETHHVLTG
ncbi:hypothetical protein V8F06_007524 [Rhypophila decipiens]